MELHQSTTIILLLIAYVSTLINCTADTTSPNGKLERKRVEELEESHEDLKEKDTERCNTEEEIEEHAEITKKPSSDRKGKKRGGKDKKSSKKKSLKSTILSTINDTVSALNNTKEDL
ncbi:unnamed protein product [Didymodactylos carnosus]|uniref:Uncharacterized protein n=1 Tax=Didymodactylos carnosus TaxID=1234261 RepID=A0A815FRD0_9BILA|nr:unnamed protein product [Didymodactylos carnosus]CAF4181883.1 unnamed protein product [Didymodactylos carnosus]